MLCCSLSFVPRLLSSSVFFLCYSWYFGDIARAEAERLLMISTNLPGTFLIRLSSSQTDTLTLSLRDSDGIKHYQIRKMTQGGGFFITSRAVFPTVAVSFKEGFHYKFCKLLLLDVFCDWVF